MQSRKSWQIANLLAPLRNLGVVARHALAAEIEASLRAVLSETMADLILEGWHTYGAIATAIRKSHTQPRVKQIVPLHTHVISADREHTLDVEVDSFPVMSLAAKAAVRLQLFARGRRGGRRSRGCDPVGSGHGGWHGEREWRRNLRGRPLPFRFRSNWVCARPPQVVVAAG